MMRTFGMTRRQTRYKGIWDAGYQAAIDEIDAEFARFLREGGQIAIDPFGDTFVVRHGSGMVAQAGSLAALRRYRPDDSR